LAKSVSVVLVGIGGYGNLYVDALLDNMEKKGVTIAGVVDPYPDGCVRLSELKERKVPLFDNLEAFYKNIYADLAVISSPIHFHNEQTCLALSKGSNVLCEKPVAASLVEADKMLRAKEKSGKFLAIGYQWSYSSAILELKKDIISGRFGKAKCLKTIVLWPRNKSYYTRKWAGRIKDDEGRLVLDSVVSNATAHFLHNMFFIMGESLDKSEYPSQMRAETYRANDIENFDTAAIQITVRNGALICFYASHAVSDNFGPLFEYEFDKGMISYDGIGRNNVIKAKFSDGEEKDYGDPFGDPQKKLWDCIAAVRGEYSTLCPIEAGIPHVACVEALHNSVKIKEFPLSLVKFDSRNELTWVEGLGEHFLKCYKAGILPSDLGINWANASRLADI